MGIVVYTARKWNLPLNNVKVSTLSQSIVMKTPSLSLLYILRGEETIEVEKVLPHPVGHLRTEIMQYTKILIHLGAEQLC